MPPVDAAQPEGWEQDTILPSKVLFLVDVDPDFSADFVLALTVLATWTAEISRKQPDAIVRVLTMSSEPIHRVVNGVFRLHAEDVEKFSVLDPRENVTETAQIPAGNEAGDIRTRRIFDRTHNQIVSVKLKLPASECAEQVSWSDRVDCRDATVVVYRDADFLSVESLPPRRMDAAESQLGGFLAGLARPIRHWRVVDLVCPGDPVPVTQTIDRLSKRNVLHLDDTPLFPQLSLPNGRREVFFALLPLVGYDDRIAQFLSERSTSPTVTLAKVQMAALMVIGVNDVVQIHQTENTLNLGDAECGIAGQFASRGTIWMVLGLTKKALLMREAYSIGGAECPVQGEDIIVDLKLAAKFWKLAFTMANLLVTHGVEVLDLSLDEEEKGQLSEEDFLEISWDLLQAFVHQIAVRDGSNGLTQDVLSFRMVRFTKKVLLGIDWALIRGRDSGYQLAAGVYTNLTKPSKDSLAQVCDWTWIPGLLVTRKFRESGSLDTVRTATLQVNLDEV